MKIGTANGVADSRVYHYNLNNFGYDGTGSDVTDDHLLINNASGLLYFSRSASLAGTEPLWTSLYFYN